MQAELKNKLSERNKLLSEYEVWSYIIYILLYLRDTDRNRLDAIFLVMIAATGEEGQNTAATAAEA